MADLFALDRCFRAGERHDRVRNNFAGEEIRQLGDQRVGAILRSVIVGAGAAAHHRFRMFHALLIVIVRIFGTRHFRFAQIQRDILLFRRFVETVP